MSLIKDIIEYNKKFVEQKEYEEYISTKTPNKKAVILSCMDTRLTELLPKAMNIKNGDAKIIKNAGATIAHPFGSAIRSIIVAIYEFNAEDVIVVGHHGCGMCNLNTDDIIEKMKSRKIKEETLEVLNNAGIDVKRWLEGFSSVEESVVNSVNSIKNHPLIPAGVKVHGLIIDPKTGRLDTIINGDM